MIVQLAIVHRPDAQEPRVAEFARLLGGGDVITAEGDPVHPDDIPGLEVVYLPAHAGLEDYRALERAGWPTDRPHPVTSAIRRIVGGRTHTEVAEEIGASQQAVSAWVSGERRPRAAYLLRLAEIAPDGGEELLEAAKANER